MNNISDIINRARKIKAVALDADGVIFTGHVLEGLTGPMAKVRSHADGQGISLLRGAGLSIACITGESGIHASFLENLVKKWNDLPSVREGKWKPITLFTGAERSKKAELAKSWLASQSISLDECAAMGDDLTDYEILQVVGFSAAPAQAEDVIKNIVHYVTPRRGGSGAVRDFANFILEAKNIRPTDLPLR